jgi:hypothetical protein
LVRYGGRVTDESGVDATGATSSSIGINAALVARESLTFPDGTYKAQGLETAFDYQGLHALGNAQLVRNANGGSLISLDHRGAALHNFRIDGVNGTYTGDATVSVTAPDVMLWNLNITSANDRAIKSTAGHTQIIGGIAAGNGTWDIELGDAAAPPDSDYNIILGHGTSQATGGYLIGDGANAVVMACQFGKLKSEGDGGTGRIIGNRITGAINLEAGFAQLDDNAIGAVVVTFGDNAATALSSFLYGPSNNLSAGGSIVIKEGVQESYFHLNQPFDQGNSITFGTNTEKKNHIWHGRREYAPTVTANGGGFALGTGGTSTGGYSRVDRTLYLDGIITLGTGFSFGTGFTGISLPLPPVHAAQGLCTLTIGGVEYLAVLKVAAGTTTAILQRMTEAVSFVTAASPAAFAADDTIEWQLWYTVDPT